MLKVMTSMFHAALDAAMTVVPRLLMADCMTMFDIEKTALCTPAGRPIRRMCRRLLMFMRSLDISRRI